MVSSVENGVMGRSWKQWAGLRERKGVAVVNEGVVGVSRQKVVVMGGRGVVERGG